MSETQSPSVEIAAPTVIISNSDEGTANATEHSASSDDTHSGESIAENSGNELASSIGDDNSSQSEPVVIAAIEAERDIALAEIHSETERERIAVEAERVETVSNVNEELEECRREIAILTGKVVAMEILLTPPQPLEIVETEELPTALETDLIQPSTAAPTVEQEAESLEESVEERAEEIIPSRVRRFIAI